VRTGLLIAHTHLPIACADKGTTRTLADRAEPERYSGTLSFTVQTRGFSMRALGLTAQTRGFSMRALGLTVQTRGFSMRALGLTARAGGFTVRAGGFTVRAGGFTARAGGFTARTRGFTAQTGGFSVRTGGFTVRTGGFAVRTRGFTARTANRSARSDWFGLRPRQPDSPAFRRQRAKRNQPTTDNARSAIYRACCSWIVVIVFIPWRNERIPWTAAVAAVSVVRQLIPYCSAARRMYVSS